MCLTFSIQAVISANLNLDANRAHQCFYLMCGSKLRKKMEVQTDKQPKSIIWQFQIVSRLILQTLDSKST